MTENRTATKRQRQILAYVRQYIADNYWAPTQQEIADALGVWASTVYRHLLRMEAAGLIKREPGISRGIVIL